MRKQRPHFLTQDQHRATARQIRLAGRLLTAALHPTPDPAPAELIGRSIDTLELTIRGLLAGGAGVAEVNVAFLAALRRVIERGEGDGHEVR